MHARKAEISLALRLARVRQEGAQQGRQEWGAGGRKQLVLKAGRARAASFVSAAKFFGLFGFWLDYFGRHVKYVVYHKSLQVEDDLSLSSL